MKRFFAAVFLLAALGVLLKLAFRPDVAARNRGRVVEVPPIVAVDEEASHGRDLVAKYPDASELVQRVYDAYRLNAIAIERTDGLRGLELLDKLGIEALYLYDKHPSDFRRLRDTLNDAAAADVLLHWREYFADKRNDHNDRRVLIAEIGRLKSEARKIAAVRPNLLPLLMAEPDGLIQLVRRWGADESILTDVLAVLGFISLERGNVDLRSAIRTLDHHGLTALDAFRAQGLDGFALVGLYGEVLELRGGSLDPSEALILLRVNSDYVDEFLRSHRPEIVAQHLQHVVGAGLVKQAGGSTQALRLFVEHGSKGEEALRRAGPDAADVVYGDYADPTLRNQAVAALAEHGTAALAMLEKYAVDSDFREILRTHGPAIIPPIAQSDTSPETLALLKSKSNLSWKEWLAKGVLAASSETGQATIRLIKNDGLDRVAQLGSTSIEYYQFLPLYDLVHLGTVLSRGHAPTGGEMTWALLDGCFVIADVLSLAAAQPEGVAAAEAVRSELKSAAKTAVRVVGADAVEESIESLARRTGETAGKQLSRWWVVRAAGGTYEVLKRTPEAFEELGFDQIAGIGRALSTKAGLHLSTWAPMRFLRDGLEVVKQVPRERGLRYLGLQLSQAGVGLVGVQKMEEYLQSRRPTPVQE